LVVWVLVVCELWEVAFWVVTAWEVVEDVCWTETGTRFIVERLIVPEVEVRAEPVAPEKMFARVEACEDGTKNEPTVKLFGKLVEVEVVDVVTFDVDVMATPLGACAGDCTGVCTEDCTGDCTGVCTGVCVGACTGVVVELACCVWVWVEEDEVWEVVDPLVFWVWFVICDTLIKEIWSVF